MFTRSLVSIDIGNYFTRANTLAFSPVFVGSPESRPPQREGGELPLKSLVGKYHGSPGENSDGPPANEQIGKDGDVEIMEANIQYQGSYSDVIHFFNLVEQYPRKIHISRLNMSKGQSGAVITGSVNLHFYGVPQLHEQDRDYLTWEAQAKYGRNNPFLP